MFRRPSLVAALAAAAVVAVVGVVAAVSAWHHSSGTSGTPGPSSGGGTATLIPATAKVPAAGVCGRASGRVLTVRIEPDAPNPRCAAVDAQQRLRVVNRTGDDGQPARTVTVTWLPGQSFTLRPGESRTFQRPFGDYLAQGVHDLAVGTAYRSEIWLH